MSSNESNGSNPNSIRAQLQKIEESRIKLMQDLENKVANLPAHLGLGSLQEVFDLVRAKNETGSVEAFAGAALPQRVESLVSSFGGRRRGQRGKAIASHTRKEVEDALKRGEQGILISRRLGISASTVSGVRKSLESAGVLKNG